MQFTDVKQLFDLEPHFSTVFLHTPMPGFKVYTSNDIDFLCGAFFYKVAKTPCFKQHHIALYFCTAAPHVNVSL